MRGRGLAKLRTGFNFESCFAGKALLIVSLLALVPSAGPGKETEDKANAPEAPRVQDARKRNLDDLKKTFEKAGLAYPPKKIFVRVFKLERSVELWALEPESGQFKLFEEYRACALSGNVGPKRKQGDHQTPEGFYNLSEFNPQSQFHLSLRVDYPNRSDRAFCDQDHPGGDIFIHGACVSDGCVAIRDQPIERLYLIAADAKANGQKTLPVHIFPCRMDSSVCRGTLAFFSMKDQDLQKFWDSLKPGYEYFEKNRTVPAVKIGADGYYRIDEK
jgi:murein L,D-transpeptidase YafK